MKRVMIHITVPVWGVNIESTDLGSIINTLKAMKMDNTDELIDLSTHYTEFIMSDYLTRSYTQALDGKNSCGIDFRLIN